MKQQFLALYDNRPFFERALQYGIKNRIIHPEKIDEILENGPKGMVQIAHVFGTEYLRPDLMEARNRIVNLVGLYLENASEGDVEKAAKLLADNTFLSLSKGGSEMVKFIHRLPDTAILGADIGSTTVENSYDAYAPGKSIVSGTLSKYKINRYDRMRKENLIRACEWFMKRFSQLHKEDVSGYDAKGVLNTLVLFSLDGYKLRNLPSEQEIVSLLRKKQGSKIEWDTILEDIPVVYVPYIRDTVSVIGEVLKRNFFQSHDVRLFESTGQDIANADDYATQVDSRWTKLTKGEFLNWKEKQTLLFSFLSGGNPQITISLKEAKKMIEYLTEHTPEYEQSIDSFIEHNVPYEYHENIRQQWVSLAKEMGTLYEKDVPMSTKIWILKEVGCNIGVPRKRTPKKVTTETK